jgi:carbonic anhydrase
VKRSDLINLYITGGMSERAWAMKRLFEKNRAWAEGVIKERPDFFQKLSAQQNPRYLWIGCSDSRVPATEICGLEPGEIFVHRNVANLVIHTDLNCLSVIHYAVEVLGVRDIIVCGHYGCGGVQAATERQSHGLLDNWLRNIMDVYLHNREELDRIGISQTERVNRLCELNVQAQVAHLAATTIVQDAWERGAKLAIHGLIYGLSDGLLKNLEVSQDSIDRLPDAYRMSRLPLPPRV